ncbi:hypothetical protein ACHGLA_02550 [Streptomyces sp. YH02]|uniref:hypothetical protein n=1 Tax=Streptomyces sp. YH02 TaxID=3256999 RepID=UPI0037580651
MSAPFPAGLRGADRAGVDGKAVDMVMLDSDTAGCVMTWRGDGTSLDARGWRVLRLCVAHLSHMLPSLEEADDPRYWQRLRDIGQLVLDAEPQSG